MSAIFEAVKYESEVILLKDKLHRRNVQIKALKKKIEELENPVVNPYLLTKEEIEETIKKRLER